MIENPKVVHDTIRVVKTIADTIKHSSTESIDLLGKMDSFYNNAWTKLILVITIAFTIIGIVVPLLIQWYQKRELKIGEDKLREDIKNAIAVATADFTKYVDEQVQKKFNELDEKVSKHLANLDGKTFQLQGQILFSQGDHSSIGPLLVALESFAKADRLTNLKNLLRFSISDEYGLTLFTKEEVEKAIEEQNIDYKNILGDIKEKFDDGEVKRLCKKLETLLNSLS